jgi:hypothetical protein
MAAAMIIIGSAILPYYPTLFQQATQQDVGSSFAVLSLLA